MDPNPKNKAYGLPRAIKNPNKEVDVRGIDIRREPIQSADPRPSKRLNASQENVLCSLPVTVVDVQPRRTP